MGIEVQFVGERSLKGLEVAEALSLVFPTALLGRLETPTLPPSAATSRTQFSLDQLMQLNMLAVRLEALATSRVFRPDIPRRSIAAAPLTGESGSTEADEDTNNPAIWRGDPDVIIPRFKTDPSDQDFMLLLDHISGRIENALSSIQIRSMMQAATATGPPPRLEDIDPHTLLQAIRIVQGLMSPIVR